MDVIKIGVIGLMGAILATTLRDDKSYGFLISVATGLVLLFLIVPVFSDIFNNFTELGEGIGINSRYVSVMIKALGVAYVSMFSSQICRDFGQNSIADKIELGGKVIILLNAMTVINELIGEMLSFIM